MEADGCTVSLLIVYLLRLWKYKYNHPAIKVEDMVPGRMKDLRKSRWWRYLSPFPFDFGKDFLAALEHLLFALSPVEYAEEQELQGPICR